MKNKSGKLIVIGIVAVVAALGLWLVSSYNGLVGTQTAVESQWANVQSKLQRRGDLVPNLVSAVKGSMQQEQEIFNNIAEARKEMAGAKTVAETSEASTAMDSALSRLLVVMENYPEVKSNENVKTLMTELEGSENRISVERDRYNDVVKSYNTKIRKFPTNLVAGMLGFEKEDFFEADESAQTVPTVDFNN